MGEIISSAAKKYVKNVESNNSEQHGHYTLSRGKYSFIKGNLSYLRYRMKYACYHLHHDSYDKLDFRALSTWKI